MEVIANNSADVFVARNWLNEHKDEEALSWPQIGKLTDVASGSGAADERH